MKVITIKSGPFAFGGIHVKLLKVGEVYEGKRAQELKDAGWAEEIADQDIEAEGKRLAEEAEAEGKRLAEEAEAEGKRLAEEAEAKRLSDKKESDEKAEAQILADAQKLAEDQSDEKPSPKAKAKSKKGK